MKIGIVSDIHGQPEALRRTLEDMPSVDLVLCAGDVISDYRFCAETVEILRRAREKTGIGIVTDLREFDELLAAFAFAREHDRDEEVLIEPWIAGSNLRVAVIGGQVVAAAEVARPFLEGDGRASITELVARLNEDGRRGSWCVFCSSKTSSCSQRS